ncbi:hypothetical protein IWX75_003488 [Arthrobacter sp. CAN_A6]|uniref:DUF1440 domain-containing protein n=1 Tax=Arthrobacter sp. CAN_A6 TaxID=2787721 RepID=UPI0018CBC434
MTSPTPGETLPDRPVPRDPSGNEHMESSPVPGAAVPAHHVGPERSIAVDMLLGAVAGAAGVWAMDRVGWFLYNHEDPAALEREHQARTGGKDVAHAAIEKAADMTGINLPTGEPNPAGIAMHYALGVLPGALYGAARHKVPALRAGNGALYGCGLFALMDETVDPALGIAAGPTHYPWQAHVRGLVSHIVLGITTETVLRASDRVR